MTETLPGVRTTRGVVSGRRGGGAAGRRGRGVGGRGYHLLLASRARAATVFRRRANKARAIPISKFSARNFLKFSPSAPLLLFSNLKTYHSDEFQTRLDHSSSDNWFLEFLLNCYCFVWVVFRIKVDFFQCYWFLCNCQILENNVVVTIQGIYIFINFKDFMK